MRMRMFTAAVALALVFPALGARAAAILVNEYNGVAAGQYLNGGTAGADAEGGAAADPYFTRVLGNGGDWLELVVVQDHLDLRGNSLSIAEGIGAGRTTTVLTFTQNSLWSDLRSGTIVTVAEDVADDPNYAPLAGDWWINVQASNTASGLFITASNFSVSNDDTQITVLDALSTVLFGPAGEGIQPISTINNREIWKLEANPSAAITPTSGYNDGTSSTFGAPNRWSSGTNVQDFSALRAVVPEPAAATLVGVGLLGLLSAVRAGARRSA
jgi:hypothetical protein